MPCPPRPRTRPPLAAMGLAALAVLSSRLPHARAGSGPCPYYLNTGTATDPTTGLTWETQATSTQFPLSGAVTHCAGLTLGSVAAGTWRLPTLPELRTLVHEGKAPPAIDPTFTDGQQGFFWSSTSYAPDPLSPGSHWGVYFDVGNAATQGVSVTASVRCVHE
jgi:hypothetical protein